MPEKKHGKEQHKAGLSWGTKATEDIKKLFPSSFSLPHGKLLPWITSSQAVTHGPLAKLWALGHASSLDAKELHLVTVLPAKTRKLCSPSLDNKGSCKGAGVFPTKDNKWCCFYQKRHKDNQLSVWFTWRLVKDVLFPHFLSVLPDLKACLHISPAGFLSWVCLGYLWRKKKNTQFALLP